MQSVASQLIEEVTAHARSDSLEDARGICADDTYFPNNLRRVFLEGSINKLLSCEFTEESVVLVMLNLVFSRETQ